MTGTGVRAHVPILSGAVENSITVHAPPDVVFDYMTDVRNDPQWNPQMLQLEKLTPGEIGRGTPFRVGFVPGVGEAIIEDVTFDGPAHAPHSATPDSWTSRPRAVWCRCPVGADW